MRCLCRNEWMIMRRRFIKSGTGCFCSKKIAFESCSFYGCPFHHSSSTLLYFKHLLVLDRNRNYRSGIQPATQWRHIASPSSTVWPDVSVPKRETKNIMKMAVFWDVAPCSRVDVYRRFRGVCCLYHQGNHGGSKHLWNVGKVLPDYAAQFLRRQLFSH
jgi:hypothetical protein